MEKNKRRLGEAYEHRIGEILENRGYQILEQNYHTRYGEIDIICRKDNYLVFVEVKYRSSTRFGFPQESVDVRKQRRICNSASYYLYRHHLPFHTPCRFDVAAVSGNAVQIIEDAFPYCGFFDM